MSPRSRLSTIHRIVSSLRYRRSPSASLHPAQRALGFVMSSVKRCAQSGSGFGGSRQTQVCRQNKRPCNAWSFVCWIPAVTYSPLVRNNRAAALSLASLLCLPPRAAMNVTRSRLSTIHRIVSSLRYRRSPSASLHPAQRALGFVMSSVKRCAQSGSWVGRVGKR